MGGECQAWHMGANFRDSGRRVQVQVQVLGCSEGAARLGAGNDATRSRRGSFKSPCAGERERRNEKWRNDFFLGQRLDLYWQRDVNDF